MKIKKLLFFFLLSGLVNGITAQDFENPEEYQNYILAEQTQFINNNIAYIAKILYDPEVRRDEEQRCLFLEQIDQSICKLEKMPSFKDDISLKESGLKTFNAYRDAIERQARLADSLKIGKKSSFNEMKVYYQLQNEIEKEFISVGKKFEKTLKGFTRKNNRGKSNNSCLFNKVAEVNSHCRRIYLSYYSLSKVNQDFFEALKKRKAESMEQIRKNLVSTAEQALGELENEEKEGGYKSYLVKGIKFANYLKEQALQEYPELVQIAAKKNATFDDANKFNAIVISYYKKAKHMVEDFNQASMLVMKKSIIHESNQAFLHGHHKDTDILSKVNQDKTTTKTHNPRVKTTSGKAQE